MAQKQLVPPNPSGFGYGYRQQFGSPSPMGSNVGTGPFTPTQQVTQINQQAGQRPVVNQPQASSYPALVEALAAQQMGQTAQRQKALGSGLMWAPGNNKRNIAAGALSSFFGDRTQKKADAAQKEALRLADDDKQKKQDAIFQAAYDMALANGASPDQASAYGKAMALGIDAKLSEAPTDSDKLKEVKERENFLKANPDITKRIGQDAADKFLLTGNWRDGSGMSLQVTPDGGVIFSEDGQATIAAPTNTIKTRMQKGAMDADAAQDALESIADSAKREFLTAKGRVGAWLGGKLDVLGLEDNELAEFGAERKAWANEVWKRVMAYRKEVTGVAGGEKEMAKIENMMANPNLGPESFARAIESEIRAAQRDANLIRDAQGQDPIEFEPYTFEFGADDKKEPVTGTEDFKIITREKVE